MKNTFRSDIPYFSNTQIIWNTSSEPVPPEYIDWDGVWNGKVIQPIRIAPGLLLVNEKLISRDINGQYHISAISDIVPGDGFSVDHTNAALPVIGLKDGGLTTQKILADNQTISISSFTLNSKTSRPIGTFFYTNNTEGDMLAYVLFEAYVSYSTSSITSLSTEAYEISLRFTLNGQVTTQTFSSRTHFDMTKKSHVSASRYIPIHLASGFNELLVEVAWKDTPGDTTVPNLGDGGTADLSALGLDLIVIGTQS